MIEHVFGLFKKLEASGKTNSFRATLTELERLHLRPEGWNGYNVAAPDQTAINRAQDWLRDHKTFFSSGWIKPHVTSSPEGYAVLEWWNAEKKITLFFSPTNTDYLRSWGTDLDSEMEEGVLDDDPQQFAFMWKWLSA